MKPKLPTVNWKKCFCGDDFDLEEEVVEPSFQKGTIGLRITGNMNSVWDKDFDLVSSK